MKDVLGKLTREEWILVINLGVLLLILISYIISRISTAKMKKKVKGLLAELKKDGVADMLKECSNGNNILKDELKQINGKISEIEKVQSLSIKKVGIIRYNPFKNMGSDLSFSLALLDSSNDGLIISSLYSRENSFVYAKPIKRGTSEYKLSNEEEEALKIAKKNFTDGIDKT